jgi:hypothetical protein
MEDECLQSHMLAYRLLTLDVLLLSLIEPAPSLLSASPWTHDWRFMLCPHMSESILIPLERHLASGTDPSK